MSFGLDPGKLGFKLGDVLVGLKSGTTDTPETITSDQGRMHTLGYVWNPSTLAYELPTVAVDGGLLVSVSNPGSTTYSLRVDDDGAGTLYVGEAEIGSDDTDPAWRIKKLVTSGTITALYWPGSATFTYRWDQRATLTYS